MKFNITFWDVWQCSAIGSYSCGARGSEGNYKSSDGTAQVQSKIDGLLLLLGTKEIECVWRGHYCIGGFFFFIAASSRNTLLIYIDGSYPHHRQKHMASTTILMNLKMPLPVFFSSNLDSFLLFVITIIWRQTLHHYHCNREKKSLLQGNILK